MRFISVLGGFQLEFVSISRVINNMSCYKFRALIAWPRRGLLQKFLNFFADLGIDNHLTMITSWGADSRISFIECLQVKKLFQIWFCSLGILVLPPQRWHLILSVFFLYLISSWFFRTKYEEFSPAMIKVLMAFSVESLFLRFTYRVPLAHWVECILKEH